MGSDLKLEVNCIKIGQWSSVLPAEWSSWMRNHEWGLTDCCGTHVIYRASLPNLKFLLVPANSHPYRSPISHWAPFSKAPHFLKMHPKFIDKTSWSFLKCPKICLTPFFSVYTYFAQRENLQWPSKFLHLCTYSTSIPPPPCIDHSKARLRTNYFCKKTIKSIKTRQDSSNRKTNTCTKIIQKHFKME